MRQKSESIDTGARKKKGEPKIDIYRAWCKACGICVAFCPTEALGKDEAGYPYVKDIKRCIHCGWCEIRCPDFAITVEPAVKEKRDREERSEEEAESERSAATGE